MRTKTPDRPRLDSATDTISYWLEDDLGRRVSKLFARSEKALTLAGRVLENVGSLNGWAVACRDRAGARRVIASGKALELMAEPFMPVRTPAEAESLRRLNEARRAIGFRRLNKVADETVY